MLYGCETVTDQKTVGGIKDFKYYLGSDESGQD